MEYKVYYNGKYENIVLAKEPISSGGQGWVYKLSSSSKFKNYYCVKIYKDDSQCEKNREKLEYMVNHAPKFVDYENIKICWPVALVYESSKFVGFMMPLAFPNSRSLRILETHSIGRTIADKFPADTAWHNKFEITMPDGLLNRVRMLYNWALALEIIHESGKYVLVDVKPDNVLATPTGKISIVDADSIQIVDGNHLFKGPVATPDYFSFHAQSIEQKKQPQTFACDMFSFAIAAYKILIGSHPYAGFILTGYTDDELDQYSDISSHIKLGLYAHTHNPEKKKHIEFLKDNNLHEAFFNYPRRLQRLFNRTFVDDGVTPTASEWRIAFDGLLGNGPIQRTQARFPGEVSNENYTNVRCLCMLVVDVSGSMIDCVGSLNEAIRKFMFNLLTGKEGFFDYSKDQVELGLIEFDDEAKLLRYPALIEDMRFIPRVHVCGRRTNTNKAINMAIEIVEKRKEEYKAKGISYCRPWIIMLTDGKPDPYNQSDVNNIAFKIKEGVSGNHFLFNAVGVGSEIDCKYLKYISDGKYKLISKQSFSSLFKMLSASASTMGNYSGEDLLS